MLTAPTARVARATLHAPFTHAPQLDREALRRVQLTCSIGLDLVRGEWPIALADVSALGMTHAALVTDRRLIGVLDDRVRFDVPLEEIVATSSRGRIVKDLVAHTASGDVAVASGPLIAPLSAFLDAWLGLPRSARSALERPLCEPSDAEPSGATGARSARVAAWDRPAHAALAYLERASRAGRLPTATAQDFVARIVLQHEQGRYARGMSEGRWLSPIGADDLTHTFVAWFGPPREARLDASRTLVFRSARADARSPTRALIALARRRVPRFRFMARDADRLTRYLLEAPSCAPLEREDMALACAIDRALLDAEGELLMRRVAFGWDVETSELWGHDSRQIRARLAA